MNKSRFIFYAVILAMIAGAFLPAAPASAAPPQQDIDRDSPFVPGEVLVEFDPGQSAGSYQARASALAGQVGAMVTRTYDKMALLSFSPEADAVAMSERVYATGKVRSAQPNYVYWVPEKADEMLGKTLVTDGYDAPTIEGEPVRLSWEEVSKLRTYQSSAYPTFPKELLSGRSWGWDAVQADLIWSEWAWAPTVCVLDSGADTSHPDLAGKVINGYDFVNNDWLANDDNGHGTHVAGIIAAWRDNDPNSAVGVSGSSALAVKVLNAQGYGTSYSISAGLIYCANNGSVGVINMSFGSTAKDTLIWNALNYAYVNGQKVMVAAAGNQSFSTKTYPAAWSSAIVTGPNGLNNSINGALISVGAARAPSPEGYQLWVDKDGLKDIDMDEIFAPEQCASGYATASSAFGSNYGHWVDIVAPGEDIYSTTPKNYPFYENYYGSVAPNYDYLSGTSMAAAYVSGAAARVLSVMPWGLPEPRNVKTKNDLLGLGDPLTFAVDSSIANPVTGYNNLTGINDSDGQPVLYGVPYDRDGDDVFDTIMAPYCWPGWSGTAPGNWNITQSYMQNMAAMHFTDPEYDDRAAVYLNVAAAMNRGGAIAEVKGASDGQAVDWGTVTAFQTDLYAWPVWRDAAGTSKSNSRVMLINLPVNSATGKAKYRLEAFVSGLSWANSVIVDNFDVERGKLLSGPYNRITVPPANDMTFILEWNNPAANLDMYVWLPSQTTPANPLGTNGGIIGSSNALLLDYVPSEPDDLKLDNNYIGPGTLLEPHQFTPNYVWGSSVFTPYAQHFFDGGLQVGADGQGNLYSPYDYLTLKKGDWASWVGFSLYYPKVRTAGAKYQFLVTDYSEEYVSGGYWQQDGGSSTPKRYLRQEGPDFVYPVLRIWIDGKVVKNIYLDDNSCKNDDTSGWWKPMELKADNNNWISDANLGADACLETSSGLWPYGLGESQDTP